MTANQTRRRLPSRRRPCKPFVEILETRTLPSFGAAVTAFADQGREHPTRIAVGNFDNTDRASDLLILRGASAVAETSRTLSLLRSQQDGTFAPVGSGILFDDGNGVRSPMGFVAGDFVGDGADDVVVMGGKTGLFQPNTVVGIYQNDGQGNFTAGTFFRFGYAPGSGRIDHLHTGNFDAGSQRDVVAVFQHVVAAPADGATTYTVAVLKNEQGSLTPFPSMFFDVTGLQSVQVGRFNDDAIDDLVIFTQRPSDGGNSLDAGTLTVYLGSGTGTFAVDSVALPFTTTETQSLATVGRFNDDALDDLVLIEPNGNQAHILLRTAGGFDVAPGEPISLSGNGHFDTVAADFDGDERADLVTTNQVTGAISLLAFKGVGDGSLQPFPQSPLGTLNGPTFFEVGDFNNDEAPDLLTNDTFTPITQVRLFSRRIGNAPEFTVRPDPIIRGQPATLTATIRAARHLPLGTPAATGRITFTVDGVAVPEVPESPLVNGSIVPLDLSTLPKGSRPSRTIVATYAGDDVYMPSSAQQTVTVLDPEDLNVRVTFTAKDAAPEKSSPPWEKVSSGSFGLSLNGGVLTIDDGHAGDLPGQLFYRRADPALKPETDTVMEARFRIRKTPGGAFVTSGLNALVFGMRDGERRIQLEAQGDSFALTSGANRLGAFTVSNADLLHTFQIVKRSSKVDVLLFNEQAQTFEPKISVNLSELEVDREAAEFFFGAPSLDGRSISDWEYVQYHINGDNFQGKAAAAAPAPTVTVLRGDPNAPPAAATAGRQLLSLSGPTISAVEVIEDFGAGDLLTIKVEAPDAALGAPPKVAIRFNGASPELQDVPQPPNATTFFYPLLIKDTTPLGPATVEVSGFNITGSQYVPAKRTFNVVPRDQSKVKPPRITFEAFPGQANPNNIGGVLAGVVNVAPGGSYDFTVKATPTTGFNGATEQEETLLYVIGQFPPNLSFTLANGVPTGHNTVNQPGEPATLVGHFRPTDKQQGTAGIILFGAIAKDGSSSFRSLALNVPGPRVPTLTVGFQEPSRQQPATNNLALNSMNINITSDRETLNVPQLELQSPDSPGFATVIRDSTRIFENPVQESGLRSWTARFEFGTGDPAGAYVFRVRAQDKESLGHATSRPSAFFLTPRPHVPDPIILSYIQEPEPQAVLKGIGGEVKVKPGDLVHFGLGFGSGIVTPGAGGNLNVVNARGSIIAAGAGGNIIAPGAGVISRGGGTIVAAGAGGGFSAIPYPSSIVAPGAGGNVISRGAGSIVAPGAGNNIFVANGAVPDLRGAGITLANGVGLRIDAASQIIAAGAGGGIVAVGAAGNFITEAALRPSIIAGIVAAGASSGLHPHNLFEGGNTIIAAGAASIVAAGAGGIVTPGAGGNFASGSLRALHVAGSGVEALAAAPSSVAATVGGAALDAVIHAHFMLWHSELLRGDGRPSVDFGPRVTFGADDLRAAANVKADDFEGLDAADIATLQRAGRIIPLEVRPARLGGAFTPGARIIISPKNPGDLLATSSETAVTGEPLPLILGGSALTIGGDFTEPAQFGDPVLPIQLYGLGARLVSASADRIEAELPMLLSQNEPLLVALTTSDGRLAFGAIQVQPATGSLQFSAPSFSQTETGASATVTVTRSGGSDGAIAVGFGTGDDTGLDGVNYTATSGFVNFADGDTTPKTISIPLVNDNVIDNGDRSVSLKLEGPLNGAVLGSQDTAVLTILTARAPTPGSLQFSVSSLSVAENAATIQIAVTRSGGSDGAVSVDLAIAGGTAVAGRDYTASSTRVTFAPGQTEQAVVLNITSDTEVEGNETVTFSITNVAGGAQLGALTTATLTIVDDDAPPPVGTTPPPSSSPLTLKAPRQFSGRGPTVSFRSRGLTLRGGNASQSVQVKVRTSLGLLKLARAAGVKIKGHNSKTLTLTGRAAALTRALGAMTLILGTRRGKVTITILATQATLRSQASITIRA